MVGSCGINRNVWTCRELTLSKCNTLCPWTESGLEPSSLHVSPCWSYFLVPNFDRDAGYDGSKCPVWEKNVDIWSHRSRKLNFERIEHFHPQTRNLKSRHFGLWNGSEHGANTQLFFSDCLAGIFRSSYQHHNKKHQRNSVSESFTRIRWNLILWDLMQYKKMNNGNQKCTYTNFDHSDNN